LVREVEIKDNQQGLYYNNLKRNLSAIEQIKEIQSSLKQKGIEIILLKGISLISSVYSDLGMRSFADIDILVKKQDLSAIKSELEKLGYSLQSPKKASLLEEFGCGDWVFSRQNSLPLDVHWELCQYERFRNIIKFNEQKLFQEGFKPEDTLLYLSMHFALVHGFCGAQWLYDFKKMIDYYEQDFDWDLLIKKAKEANLRTVLYYTLSFCQGLLDIKVEERFLRRIKPHFLKRVFLSLFINQKNILNRDFQFRNTRGYYFCQGLLMDGVTNIIRTFAKMLFPSRGWRMFHRYSYPLQHALGALND
jgi:hypothetical protein